MSKKKKKKSTQSLLEHSISMAKLYFHLSVCCNTLPSFCKVNFSFYSFDFTLLFGHETIRVLQWCSCKRFLQWCSCKPSLRKEAVHWKCSLNKMLFVGACNTSVFLWVLPNVLNTYFYVSSLLSVSLHILF